MMNNAALSIRVFAVYVLLMGIGFVLMPNVVLSVFGIAATTEVWIRVVGLLALALAAYYLYSAAKNDLHFYRISVIGRIGFFIGMTAFALLNLGPMVLILFGLIDLIAALWTAQALRANGQLQF